jgi:hypothetical protein
MTTDSTHGPGVPTGPGQNRVDVADASVGELLGNVTRDLMTLLRQEIALAKAEVKVEAKKAGRATGMLGGAGFAGYMVLLFLSVALWGALSNVMDEGWAALIVAGIWAVLGAVLYAAGRGELRNLHPTPERTVETVKQVPQALNPNEEMR